MKRYHDIYSVPFWKRAVDIVLGGVAALVALPIFAVCCIAIRATSRGPALYWSPRVGKGNRIIMMPKFRTMFMGTPQLATHLLENPGNYVTPIGRFLRKTSIDELPQFFSVLKGELSLVGPRPALFNQHDLTALRTDAGVHRMTPGITGLAQVNGRDDLGLSDKVKYDIEYMRGFSFLNDVRIIGLTVMRVLNADGVRH
jgi:O-antigen biosynthesis protein WbqP